MSTLPEHDLTRASYSPHASDFGRTFVFDARCRRCWYDKSLADYAQILEATKAAAETLERITMVQSRSGSLIQQSAKIVAKDLRTAIAAVEKGSA